MRQLGELPRDGTADDVRDVILRRLEVINNYLPPAVAGVGDDADQHC
jgi:hypothetical protein